MLLKKSQNTFESPLMDQLQQIGACWQGRIDKEETEAKKKALEEERDEQMERAKGQYYGNIRWVSEG